MRATLVLWMVACQPSQNNVGENWADSGQHDAPTESGTPAGGGTGGDDAPPDPTADVDATTLGAGPNPCREPVLGRVYSVIDGDTIKVETGRGMERVRLIGIDAPEVDHSGPDDECYGEEATEFLEERINEKLVWLTFDSECDDHYDRTLEKCERAATMRQQIDHSSLFNWHCSFRPMVRAVVLPGPQACN